MFKWTFFSLQLLWINVAPRCASETTQRWWWCERIRLGSTRNRALCRIPDTTGCWCGGLYGCCPWGQCQWAVTRSCVSFRRRNVQPWHVWEDVMVAKGCKRLVNTTRMGWCSFFQPRIVCVFNYIECRVCFLRRFSDDLGRMDTSGWTRHRGSPSALSFSNP